MRIELRDYHDNSTCLEDNVSAKSDIVSFRISTHNGFRDRLQFAPRFDNSPYFEIGVLSRVMVNESLTFYSLHHLP